MVDLTIHGYNKAVLHKYQHPAPDRAEHATYKWNPSIYGAKTKYVEGAEDIPPLSVSANSYLCTYDVVLTSYIGWQSYQNSLPIPWRSTTALSSVSSATCAKQNTIACFIGNLHRVMTFQISPLQTFALLMNWIAPCPHIVQKMSSALTWMQHTPTAFERADMLVLRCFA
jgi:hypothetical protein